MNYKSIILIALALCLCVTMPVAAVWQNGNWIEDAKAPSVQYDPVTGVSSKYVPLVEEKNAMTDKGIVYGNLKSGTVVEGGALFSVFNDLNPFEPKVYKFSDDGRFNDYWEPGNYTITLPQGTGSAAGVYNGEVGFSGNLHPEVAHITVAAGQPSYFTFIGNSVASAPEPVEESITIRDITICTAFYRPDFSKTPIPGHVTLNFGNHFGVANVKNTVQALITSGKNTFGVSNDNLGGDPAYGWYKKLDVMYADGNTCSPVKINHHWVFPLYHNAHADEGDIITL